MCARPAPPRPPFTHPLPTHIGGRSRTCDACPGVTCVTSPAFNATLSSVEGLILNGDSIRVTAVALPFPHGKNSTLPLAPSQVDATPPVMGLVKDVLPPRSPDLDKFHPAVVKGASSDDSVVDIDYFSNPGALSCSFSAADDPESGVNASAYSMYVRGAPQALQVHPWTVGRDWFHPGGGGVFVLPTASPLSCY
jgi:hypothetical protein